MKSGSKDESALSKVEVEFGRESKQGVRTAIRQVEEPRVARSKSSSKRVEGKRWSAKSTGLFNGRKQKPSPADQPRSTAEKPEREHRNSGTVESAKTSALSALGAMAASTSTSSLVSGSGMSQSGAIDQQSSRVVELEHALQSSKAEQELLLDEIERLQRQRDQWEEDSEAYREEQQERQRQENRRNHHQTQSQRSEVISSSHAHPEPSESDSSGHDPASASAADLMTDHAFWKRRYIDMNQEYLRQGKDFGEREAAWAVELDRGRRAFHEAQRSLDRQDQELRETRRQMLDLKRSISLGTRSDGQVTDDVLREQIRSLGHALQNWTINSFRKTKFGMLSIESPYVRMPYVLSLPKRPD